MTRMKRTVMCAIMLGAALMLATPAAAEQAVAATEAEALEKAIDQAIGRIREAPLNTWQHFETEIESRPGGDRMYHDCVYHFYLANKGATGTAWFDGLKLEEIGPVGGQK